MSQKNLPSKSSGDRFVESLESRTMRSVSVSFSNNVCYISSNNAGDEVVVEPYSEHGVNVLVREGVETWGFYGYGYADHVEADMGGGDDILDCSQLGSDIPCLIDAGADDDKIYGGAGGNYINGGTGTDELYGGSSYDVICGGVAWNNNNDGADDIIDGYGIGNGGGDDLYTEGGHDTRAVYVGDIPHNTNP